MACSLFQGTTGRNIQFIYLIENLLINIRNSVDWDLPVQSVYMFLWNRTETMEGLDVFCSKCTAFFYSCYKETAPLRTNCRNGVIRLHFCDHIIQEEYKHSDHSFIVLQETAVTFISSTVDFFILAMLPPSYL